MQFVLLSIGIILIVLNISVIKKDKNPKNENFSENLNIAHDNMDKNEAEIMKMRKEMGETFYSIQEEIEDLKQQIKGLETKIINNNFKESIKKSIDILDEKEIILPKVEYTNSNNIKMEEVKKLIDKGKNIDEICEILNMGKGEVLLIKDLYLD
ncbi:hypothetical protein EQG73_08025 [Clostridium tetani]|nr:hypothetical protein EQG73_08025 [Clostridium tetani]